MSFKLIVDARDQTDRPMWATIVITDQMIEASAAVLRRRGVLDPTTVAHQMLSAAFMSATPEVEKQKLG